MAVLLFYLNFKCHFARTNFSWEYQAELLVIPQPCGRASAHGLPRSGPNYHLEESFASRQIAGINKTSTQLSLPTERSLVSFSRFNCPRGVQVVSSSSRRTRPRIRRWSVIWSLIGSFRPPTRSPRKVMVGEFFGRSFFFRVVIVCCLSVFFLNMCVWNVLVMCLWFSIMDVVSF